MENKKRILASIVVLCLLLVANGFSQVPIANFSINPNPVCTGAVVQITDLSSNSPSSWSYTLSPGGPGLGPPQLSAVQNPTISYNNAGTYTITLIATNASGASTSVSQTLIVLASPNAIINPSVQTTCVGGNPITINCLTFGPGGASNTFNWSNGSSSQSITVSPTVTTSYSCVVTSTNGCSVTRSTTVNIGNPTITVNSNPTNICPGSSSTLTATGSNPGPWTYLWSDASTTRTISTSVAGVYNVTVTNNNGCSAVQSYTLGTSSTLSLTASSNPSVICAGNTGTLHATGASSYSWNTGATTQNATVAPISNTTYTVIGLFGACTGTTTISLNVSITPTITISNSSSSLCSGQNATLNANGASSYTWTPGNILTPGIVVSPSVNTTYTVRGINTGCPARTATVSLSVLQSPILTVSNSPSLICVGETAALAVSGGNTYLWSNGSTSSILLITPTVTTSYTVSGTAINGCISTSQITQNVSECTGINQVSTQIALLSIYPNPNNGTFTILTNEVVTIALMNQLGQVLKTFTSSENKTAIPVSDLSNGLYFIVAKNGTTTSTQKVIVNK